MRAPLRLLVLLLLLVVAACGGGGGRPVVTAPASMCGDPLPAAPGSAHARQVVNTFHAKGVSAIAFASDGRLATTSYDETIRIWDPVKRALLATQHDPIFRRVNSLRWDRAHAQFVVSSFEIDGAGLTNGVEAPRIFHAPFSFIGYSEKAKEWVGFADDAMHLFDESACVGALVANHTDRNGVMSADGRWLGVLRRKGQGQPGALDLHELTATTTPTAARRTNVGGDVTAFAFTNDSEAVITTSSLNEISITPTGSSGSPRVLRVAEGERIVEKSIPEWGLAGELAVSLDGSLAVVSSINDFVVWDLRAGKRLWTRKFGLRSKGATAGKVAISPTAPLLVTLSERFALYDIRDGRDLGELGAAVEPKLRVAIQGDRLVSAGEDIVTVYSLSELDRVARHKVDPTGIGQAGQYGHMVVDDLSFAPSSASVEITTRYQPYPSAPATPWGDGSRCERPNKDGDGLVGRVEQLDLQTATKTSSTVRCDAREDGQERAAYEQFRKRMPPPSASAKKVATKAPACGVTPAANERASSTQIALSKDGRVIAVSEDDVLSIGAVDSGPIQTKRFDAGITALRFAGGSGGGGAGGAGGADALFVGLSNGKLLRVSPSDGKIAKEGATGDNEAIALIQLADDGHRSSRSAKTRSFAFGIQRHFSCAHRSWTSSMDRASRSHPPAPMQARPTSPHA